MMRDYARICGAGGGGRRRQSNGNQSHAGLWLFTIFLFIVFTLGLVLLGKYHRHGGGGAYLHKGRREAREATVQKPKAGASTGIGTDTAKTRDLNLLSMVEQEAQEVAKSNDSNKPIKTDKKTSRKKTVEATLASSSVATATQFEFTTPQALVATEDAAQKIAAASEEEINALKDKISKKNDAQKQKADAEAVGTAAGKDEEAINKTETKTQYTLEVIKTKNKSDAEKMRARLALAGVESNIAVVKEKNANYFKITLGPYPKNVADAKQQLLQKNDIKAIVSVPSAK